jgi:hypothetical protein
MPGNYPLRRNANQPQPTTFLWPTTTL